MAGSYSHLADGGWSLIEDMGDAYECVEELLYLVRAHLDDHEIEEALEEFYRFKRGEKLPEGDFDFAVGYRQTQEMLSGQRASQSEPDDEI